MATFAVVFPCGPCKVRVEELCTDYSIFVVFTEVKSLFAVAVVVGFFFWSYKSNLREFLERPGPTET